MTSAPLTLPEHGRFPEINPACATSQRWWQRRHSWTRRRDGGFDHHRYEVHPVGDPTAKSYVERMHYSGSYVAASRRYGLFLRTGDGLDLIGVAVFSIPAQSRVLTNVFPDLAPYTESLELGRFVLEGRPHPGASPADRNERAPANSETWFLRECFRYLAGDGIAGVVSFADPVPRIVDGRLLFAGHVGTIYQAKSAVLTGRSARRYVTVLPDGTSLSDRALQKVRAQDAGHDYVERRLIALGARAPRAGTDPARWLTEALAEVHATRLAHGGCLRYAMPTSTAAHRHVRIRLPTEQSGRRGAVAGTFAGLARAGVTGLPYPKHTDPPPTPRPHTTQVH